MIKKQKSTYDKFVDSLSVRERKKFEEDYQKLVVSEIMLMAKKNAQSKAKSCLSTYDTIVKDPVRKARIEKKYHELLLSELLIAIMEDDGVSVRKLAKAAACPPTCPP